MDESAAGQTLGRVEVDGRIVSARLFEKLKKPETAVEATIEDAELAAGEISGGRKRRGGTKTGDAIRALISEADKLKDNAASKLDELGAMAVTGAPGLALATATGAVIKNPSVLAKIVSMVGQGASSAIAAASTPGWGEYMNLVVEVGKQAGILAGDVVASTIKSPYIPIIVGIAIMKKRASNARISVTELIKQDSQKVFSAAARAATGAMQDFNTAYEAEAKKKVLNSLRSIGLRASSPEGLGAIQTQLAANAAPIMAAEGGPEGQVAVVRGKRSRDASEALDPLTTSNKEPDQKKIALDLSGISGLPAGGRRRKTKKRAMKKRRMTRRKLTFSY